MGLVLIGLVGCSGAAPSGSAEEDQGYVSGTGVISRIAVEDRAAAPSLEGPILGQEGTFRLEDARGKVVVVNVWASWCTPCRKETPALEKVWSDLRTAPVQFVGVNTRDREANAEAFLRRFGVTYPSIADPEGAQLLGFRDLPPNAVPSTLVLDRQGRVAARVTGEVNESTVRGLVADELAASPA